MDSQSDSQRNHKGLAMDSQRTHKGLTKDSHKIHTKIIEKALVLLGCPRKMLFLHRFYKVAREKCWFYSGFTRVVREKREQPCAKTRFFVDNPPGMVSPQEKQSTHFCLTTALASQSNRLSLAHTASPRLARSHARHETEIDFPVDSSPSTSNLTTSSARSHKEVSKHFRRKVA